MQQTIFPLGRDEQTFRRVLASQIAAKRGFVARLMGYQ